MIERMLLGRYTLVRRVGVGGMAEVWKAKVKGPAGFEKTLAIKRILPDRLTEPEYVSLFIDEAKLVARLQHPNIVQVFDFGTVEPTQPWETDTEYYMAMEYIAGHNLREITRRLNIRNNRWPIELTIFIALEASKALAYAHDAGVIHRDVSPHNILVSYDGRVKVTDFGIARVEDMLPRTAEGIRRGKISYMSPEQVDLRPLDGRSDTFSLGAVCYEMATGSKLFDGIDKSEIARKIRTFNLDEATHVGMVRGDLLYVLRKAMELDPAKRFQEARDLELEFREMLGTTGVREAPLALSSLVKELFEEEFRRETVLDEQDFEATRVQASPDSAEPSQPSGGTLISSAANVLIEEPPTSGGTEKAHLSPPAPPEDPWPRSLPTIPPGLRLGLYVVAALMLVGLGVLLSRMWPSGTAEAPTTDPVAPRVTITRMVHSTSTPAPTAKPVRTTEARATPRVVVATPTVAAQAGWLSVAARPWAEIWVDGKRVKAETPLRRHRLSAGVHVVEARHPQAGRMRMRINVASGEHVKLFVDVPRKRIETR